MLFPGNTAAGNAALQEVPCNGMYECASESMGKFFTGVVDSGKAAISSELLNDPVFACILMLIEATIICVLIQRRISKVVTSADESSESSSAKKGVDIREIYAAAIDTIDRAISLRKDVESLKTATLEKVQMLREMLDQRNEGVEIIEKDLMALKVHLNQTRVRQASKIPVFIKKQAE